MSSQGFVFYDVGDDSLFSKNTRDFTLFTYSQRNFDKEYQSLEITGILVDVFTTDPSSFFSLLYPKSVSSRGSRYQDEKY